MSMKGKGAKMEAELLRLNVETLRSLVDASDQVGPERSEPPTHSAMADCSGSAVVCTATALGDCPE